MFRIVAFWCGVVAVFFSAWGWIENTWAASFGWQYRSTYMPRAELFFWLLCLSLLALLMLAWKWIRLGLNILASWASLDFHAPPYGPETGSA